MRKFRHTLTREHFPKFAIIPPIRPGFAIKAGWLGAKNLYLVLISPPVRSAVLKNVSVILVKLDARVSNARFMHNELSFNWSNAPSGVYFFPPGVVIVGYRP